MYNHNINHVARQRIESKQRLNQLLKIVGPSLPRPPAALPGSLQYIFHDAYIYIYIYIYVYLHLHICMYMCIYIYICIYA